MALTAEWKRRIEKWKKELPEHFYGQLGEIPLKGFTTTEHLTLSEAMKGDFNQVSSVPLWKGLF